MLQKVLNIAFISLVMVFILIQVELFGSFLPFLGSSGALDISQFLVLLVILYYVIPRKK